MEDDLHLLQQHGESIRDELDSFFSVDLKSKKGNENCYFCLGRTKIHFLKVKSGKVANVLDCPVPFLTSIASPKPDEVILETKVHGRLDITSPKANQIIHALRQLIFAEIYPGLNEKENSIITVKVSEDRLDDLTKTERPCGNFKNAYLAECEANNVPIREDIVFDVEHLFSSNNIKEFNLEEFEGPLSTGDIKSLLGALRFNPFFTALKMRSMKLEKDQAACLLSCLRSNRAIESLTLVGLQVHKEFYVDLFKELQANKECAVREIDLSDNKEFGDTGVAQLSTWISNLSHGISVLDIPNCGIKGKGIASLCTALKKNLNVSTTLTKIDLSINKLEADGSSALAGFLAQPNSLSVLILKDCAANLDLLLGALNRGSCRELKELDLSHNKMPPKSTQLGTFVRSSSAITKINVSATSFSSDMLKDLLSGIKSNPYIQQVELIVSKNGLGHAGSRVLAEEAADMTNITSLDLSENEFDDESMIGITSGFAKCASVKKLDLSRNMPSKGRAREPAIEGLINLITSPETSLEHFRFCGGKGTQLGADMIKLIDAMGDCVLTSIDISGHAIGNKGASSLGKMLQSNRTLVSLSWDENGTTLVGLKNFRKGLKRNTTLKSMALPILDIEAALSKENDKVAFIKVIRDLESCIINNNSPKSKFKTKDQMQGSEFLFYSTSQREALERHIVKLKSKGKKPSDADQIAIKDAENFETVIADLHVAKADALVEMEKDLKHKLHKFAVELEPLLSQHMAKLKGKMIEIIQQGYSSLDADTVRRIGTNISFGVREVDIKQLEEVMVLAAGADIGLKSSECYSSAVDIAADYCFEKLEDNLLQITERLQQEVEEAKYKKEKKEKKHKKQHSSSSDGVKRENSSSSVASTSTQTSATPKKEIVVISKPQEESSEEEEEVEEAQAEVEAEAEVEVEEESEEEQAEAEAEATEEQEDAAEEATEEAETVSTPSSGPPPAVTPPTPGSVAPKKFPPALPKSGPPPVPKFKLSTPPASGGNSPVPPAGLSPVTPGEAKFVPKGPPPKIPAGFIGGNVVSGVSPAGGPPASGPPKAAPGKLPPTLAQLKIGNPGPGSPAPGGSAPGLPKTGPAPLRPAGGPPIPMFAPGAKKVAAVPAPAPVATPQVAVPEPKKEEKPKKEAKDKKDKTKSKPATGSVKKPKGKKEETSGGLVAPVKSQGAEAGLSAASTQSAPDGALDALQKQTASPVADPRANRAGGAARRRPPTRRPQGPSAV